MDYLVINFSLYNGYNNLHYVNCYMYYDNVKLETYYVPVIDDFCTSTGTYTTILIHVGVDNTIAS